MKLKKVVIHGKSQTKSSNNNGSTILINSKQNFHHFEKEHYWENHLKDTFRKSRYQEELNINSLKVKQQLTLPKRVKTQYIENLLSMVFWAKELID